MTITCLNDSVNQELRRSVLMCLIEKQARKKAEDVRLLFEAWKADKIALSVDGALSALLGVPGQPDDVELVSPLAVGRRPMNTPEGRAALIHALAHIEFNAINLALDAVWRFAGMPRVYYEDWLRVAAEEAYHFLLLLDYLESLGYRYGSFTAHNSLWEMAEKTKHDILARIALVPRTMEARGLDATPVVRAKLAQVKDETAVKILDIILHDEIGHVAVGNRWYNYLCQLRGVDPIVTYEILSRQFSAPLLRGPFNIEARKAAGFSDEELSRLMTQEKTVLLSVKKKNI
jgi:uncharacterized ferritin-like protein (DUF455 family)